MNFNFKASDIAKHSAAHVLAAAVKRIFPTLKVGLGPVTKSGFYYDFEIERPLTDEDLPLIEKNINQIMEEDLPFQQSMMDKNEGFNLLLQIGQVYKAEVVSALTDDQVSFYKLGEEFIDLCRGPHLKSTKDIGIIKLTGFEETHWNNDTTRPKMYRIHGVVFQNIVEYNEYIESIQLQEGRDVLKLSIKNNYITKLNDEYLFTDEGSSIVQNIRKYIQDRFSDLNLKFLENHSHSFENSIEIIDRVYNNENRSYKSLPMGYVQGSFKKQESFELTVPEETIKIFSLSGQEYVYVGDLVEKVVDISNYFAKQDINIEIRCKDFENKVVKTLSNLLQKRIISHNKILSNKIEGMAEIEFSVIDNIGKKWDLFKLEIPNVEDGKNFYYSNQNTKVNTFEIVIKYNLFEIYSYLIEEYGLDIHFKLKPVQVVCIPKSKSQFDYARSVYSHISNNGFNAELDLRSLSLRAKIKDAELKKIDFIFIMGIKEQTNNAISVRSNNNEVGLVSTENIIKFINENRERT